MRGRTKKPSEADDGELLSRFMKPAALQLLTGSGAGLRAVFEKIEPLEKLIKRRFLRSNLSYSSILMDTALEGGLNKQLACHREEHL
jgi:hypothetical protein